MKKQIESLLKSALLNLQESGVVPKDVDITARVSEARDPTHGDLASNIALVLAKRIGMAPRELAEKIIDNLPESSHVSEVKIAGPGFINFFLAEGSFQPVVEQILNEKSRYGTSDYGKGQRIHIEYVSANPTGPLHVGHGRGAAYGACVANLLTAIGFDVHREYYVNDAGRQMRILGLSVWIRYLQAVHEKIALPKSAYQGDYIVDIANDLHKAYGERFHISTSDIESKLANAPDPEKEPDAYLDSFVDLAKSLLGDENFSLVFQHGLKSILSDIQDDLAEFGVTYDQWFPESELVKAGLINEGISLLAKHGYVYENEGAKWFKATALGDDKDRVLIRNNGISTYFASDVAYHLYKYNQDYDYIVDVFGSDHHGYIPRIRSFLKGLGKDPEKLRTLLVQFAILYRGKEKVSMSTRGGQFVTLRELRNEVGNDAARFFYIMRKPEQHLDFDLELAKSRTNENPVYYIQYAHARICSVWRQLKATQNDWNESLGLSQLSLLNTERDKDILTALARYPEVIQNAALQYEPHLITHYLQSLANHFHTYYNAERFLIDDEKLRNARLCLIAAVQIVLANGLSLLGISAPEEM